jgi:hypothetical protein
LHHVARLVYLPPHRELMTGTWARPSHHLTPGALAWSRQFHGVRKSRPSTPKLAQADPE